MATIFDLNTSITSMSREEAMKRVIELRRSRLIPKKSSRKFVKRTSSPKKKKDPLKSVGKQELLKLLIESL